MDLLTQLDNSFQLFYPLMSSAFLAGRHIVHAGGVTRRS